MVGGGVRATGASSINIWAHAGCTEHEPPEELFHDTTSTHPDTHNHSTWRLAEVKACMIGGEKVYED